MKTADYYKLRYIQYNILESTQGRECFFKDALGSMHIRPLNLFSMAGIEFGIKSNNFDKKPFHFYSSVALIDWSKMSRMPSDRSLWADYRKEFNRNFNDMIVGYDFLLDIDSDLIKLTDPEEIGVSEEYIERQKLIKHLMHENKVKRSEAKEILADMLKDQTAEIDPNKSLEKSHHIAEKIGKIYDDFGVPFSMIFSGKKGFHFRICWEHLKEISNEDPFEAVTISKAMAEALANKVGFEFGSDIDSIYDIRRVARVPYSVHPDTGLIALPLSCRGFEKFNASQFKPEFVLREYRLKNRGLKIKPGIQGAMETMRDALLKSNGVVV